MSFNMSFSSIRKVKLNNVNAGGVSVTGQWVAIGGGAGCNNTNNFSARAGGSGIAVVWFTYP
jgi:hypothetical protein